MGMNLRCGTLFLRLNQFLIWIIPIGHLFGCQLVDNTIRGAMGGSQPRDEAPGNGDLPEDPLFIPKLEPELLVERLNFLTPNIPTTSIAASANNTDLTYMTPFLDQFQLFRISDAN